MKSVKYGIRGVRGWSYSVVTQDNGNKFIGIEFSCPQEDLKVKNGYLNQRFYLNQLESVLEAVKQACIDEGITLTDSGLSYVLNEYSSEEDSNPTID